MNQSVFKELISKFSESVEDLLPKDEEINEVFSKLQSQYQTQDPWGLDLEYCKKAIRLLMPLYKNYFKVRVFGADNISNEPYIFTSNHSGQIAIDGLLITMALALEADDPRIARPMIERFMADLPFITEAAFRCGAVLGDRTNCLQLLKMQQSVLVFPEGVRGVSKSTNDFYKLQKFTKGFYRMAISSNTKIVPIAVVGAEEIYPFVYQAKGLAKMLNIPALPITPFFPWLGALGAIPLPSPIDIYIGTPYQIPPELTENAPDKDINHHINQIENEIDNMLKAGLKKRRNFIDPKEILKKFKL